MSIPLAAGGAVAACALGAAVWFLFRSWRRKARVRALLTQAELHSAGSREAIAARDESAGKQMESALAGQLAQKERAASEALHALKLPQATTKKAEVLGKHLVEEAKKDPVAMAHLIRAWLNESDT
ncbi:MAG: hypothetical protein HY822_24515 [Acidobacteria bacterium]|nr:hypothetical protein [Acidobacteriota bacterium]